MLITKEFIEKELSDLLERLDTVNAIGIARAVKLTPDDQNIKENIIVASRDIMTLQEDIQKLLEQLKDIDVTDEEFRDVKYKLEYCRLDALKLLEKILEFEPAIDLDNTEIDPVSLGLDDDEDEEESEEEEE